VDTDAPPSIRRLVHVPSLDILRAFAVSLVVLSHLWEVAPWFHFREIFSNAGFLGVDLFFVLSGFLITALLLQEQYDTGRIRFSRFYLRRVIRLLPALLAMIGVYLVYAQQTGWPPFGRRDFAFDSVRATLLYGMNWQVLWNI
jgi:peptidoglycan/LPS O-acetylase OafA/YrhL